MKRIQHRSVVLAAALGMAMLFSGCDRINQFRNRNQPAPGGFGDPGAFAMPSFAVYTTQAVRGQILDYLALSGDIVSGTSVDTYSDAAGKVTRIYVAVGNRVNRNDPVVAVDPSRPGMDYQANIVRAPISGTVIALPAQVGMTVSQSVPLARIAGGNALEIRVYVAERFISKIALGQSCRISLDAWPGEYFRGSVSEISPVVDAASRTMEARINVDNPGSKLKAGMFAKVRIITEAKNNIVKIPSGALVQRSGENYVFTVDTDPMDPAFRVARRQQVTPGILVDGVLEIQRGLEPDQEIIVRGQTFLEDGLRINVVEQIAPLSAVN
jgi:multidrug efflux pump subunit AcrA (membrane-fusion protein)